jgi:cell wall-associated NlpC family hydrolase
MAERGPVLRRRTIVAGLACLASASILSTAAPAAAATPASWREGEHGSGPPAPDVVAAPSARLHGAGPRWADLEPDDQWARPAIDHVARVNDWMRDRKPNRDGTLRFSPDAFETRRLWARALVRAFARDEEPDPGIRFPDLETTSRFWRSAAIAVEHRWLTRARDGRFLPNEPVSARVVNRSLVTALGMRATAAAIDRLSTTDGRRFRTPKMFGYNLLALRLGLRFNNRVDESQDVVPGEPLRRKQAAWSLYRATTLDHWEVPNLQEQYAGIQLPRMSPKRRSIVAWGIRYVGYPYIWGGEWGFDGSEPPAFGSQPGPGFDCSGLSWWALRRDEGPWQISPPRPYRGWSLPQRTSAQMAAATTDRLRYRELKPGDLMFYDGDGDRTVDHVDVYVGRGWALDSSSSVGGVTLMWVESGWYRDHFVHGRRVLRRA